MPRAINAVDRQEESGLLPLAQGAERLRTEEDHPEREEG